MTKNVTRTGLIGMWFVVVTVCVAGAIVLGATITLGTAAILLALTIAPAVMVLLLWTGAQPRTAADVLYDRNPPA